jgi:hypothetical protein
MTQSLGFRFTHAAKREVAIVHAAGSLVGDQLLLVNAEDSSRMR